MTAVRVVLLLVMAAAVDATFLADVRIFGVAGQALLLVAILGGVAGGPDKGARIGFAAGLTADLFTTTPFGLSSLAFCLVGYAVGSLQSSILRSARWIPVVIASIASAAGIVTFALAGMVVGVSHLLTTDLLVIAPTVGLINGALAVIAEPVVRWAVTSRADRLSVR